MLMEGVTDGWVLRLLCVLLSFSHAVMRSSIHMGSRLLTMALLTFLLVMPSGPKTFASGTVPGSASCSTTARSVRIHFTSIRNFARSAIQPVVHLADGTTIADNQDIPLTDANGSTIIDPPFDSTTRGLRLRRDNGFIQVTLYGYMRVNVDIGSAYGTIMLSNGTFTSFVNAVGGPPGLGIGLEDSTASTGEVHYAGNGTHGFPLPPPNFGAGHDDEVTWMPAHTPARTSIPAPAGTAEADFFLGVSGAQDLFTLNYSPSATTCPPPAPAPSPADLSLSLSIPPQLEPLSDIDLPELWKVTNVGSVTVTSATVTQPIPAGMTFNSNLSNSACTSNGTLISCQVPSINPGQSLQWMVYFNMPRDLACNSTITEQIALASSNPADNNASNNTATVSSLITCPSGPVIPHGSSVISSSSSSSSSSAPSASAGTDISAMLTLPPQINRGDNLPEVFGVKNTGTTTISSSMLTQTIPAGFVLNTTLTNSACSANGSTLTCQVPSLSPGQSMSFMVYLTVPTAQTCMSTLNLQETANASGDRNSANNTSSASVLVTCP